MRTRTILVAAGLLTVLGACTEEQSQAAVADADLTSVSLEAPEMD